MEGRASLGRGNDGGKTPRKRAARAGAAAPEEEEEREATTRESKRQRRSRGGTETGEASNGVATQRRKVEMGKEKAEARARKKEGEEEEEEDEREEEEVEGLTLYELYRRPMLPIEDSSTTTLQIRTLNVELTCPICLGIIRRTMTVMECLHRFCADCISKCLRLSKKKECPTCRVHCSSRRHLRPDPNFDKLIAAIYPNLDEYEAQEASFIEDINKSLNRKALTDSVERGIKRQAAAVRRSSTSGSSSSTPVPSPMNTRRSRRKSSASAEPASPEPFSKSSTTKPTTPSSTTIPSPSATPSSPAASSVPTTTKPPQPQQAPAGTSTGELQHYHMPKRKHQLATKLANNPEFIDFVLYPHPNETQLPVLDKNCLKTNKSATVQKLTQFLAKRIPPLLSSHAAPTSEGMNGNGHYTPENREDSETFLSKVGNHNNFRISILVPTVNPGSTVERNKYVTLERNDTLECIRNTFWDQPADMVLYYSLDTTPQE
ncbi:E3 ubiquitin-protein ligase RING2 [Balamuthia mandrillaris]